MHTTLVIKYIPIQITAQDESSYAHHFFGPFRYQICALQVVTCVRPMCPYKTSDHVI